MHALSQVGTIRREYSLTTGRKIGQSALAGVFLVGAGFFLRSAIDPIGRDFVLAVGGILLILGLALIAQAWISRLILDGNRVEVRSVFRTRSATLAEVEGIRKTENQYGRWTRVYLKQNLGNFSISDFYADNGALQEWLKELPDLDRRDADEISKQIDTHERIAQKGTGSAKRLDLAKAWTIGLSVLAGAVSIPVMFISYVPLYRASLVALLLCPAAGIMLLRVYPLLFTAFRREHDPRAELGVLLAWPGIGLMFSYQNSNDPTHLVDKLQLIYWVLAVLFIVLASVMPAMWKSPSRWAVFFFLIITGGMYSIGLVNSLNTLLDHSPSHPFVTWVLNKSESYTSKGTRHFLLVAPWGPIPYSEDVDVPMGTFKATRIGDPVCYGLHAGFLHGPWYSAVNCSERPAFSR